MKTEKVGRYELIAPLGQGGMGEVYRAYDPELNREVAVKIIVRPIFDSDAQIYRRFKREVQSAARLNHNHIITIYDVNLDHRPPYVVMELLTGGTLTEFLNKHTLDWAAALRLLEPVCAALGYAHKAGIVHRDVKPDNILFADPLGEQPKLADFGLAFMQDEDRLTQDGTVLGTLSYLSPEQALGTPIDARADIFSLGIILFEALAGFNPLKGNSISQTLINAASLEPIDLSPLEGKVPEGVITLLAKALAKERRLRYPSCQQLNNDIDRLLGEHLPVITKPEPKTAGPELRVENPYAIYFMDIWQEILQQLFTGYRQVTIEEELTGGFSGSSVYVVKPLRSDGTPELPSVVKIGPVQLIEAEWQAYQEHIRHKLPGIAEIRGNPVFPAGGSWGGIHYAMIGSGTFYFESFTRYYRRATDADLTYILNQRLFRQLGRLWRYNTPQTSFNLAASYDRLLPVNLVIRPTPGPVNGGLIDLRAGSTPADTPSPGTTVVLKGFIVVEVDEDEQAVTLDWSVDKGSPGSYRVRLQPVSDVAAYQVGWVQNDITGVVATNRLVTIKATLLDLFGVETNTSASELTVPGYDPLPNPLARLPNMLASRPTVRLASIHGDLNPENFLVDPETRDVQLIDFGSARRDHVLHDLLRLETGIITRLLPDTLKRARLPEDAVVNLLTAVHNSVFVRPGQSSTELIHPDLEKPYSVLRAVRQAAVNLLFDVNEPAEYYQGLTIYLLGSLKYRNLDHQAKRIAYYAAAAAQSLVDNPKPAGPEENLAASTSPNQTGPSEWPSEDFVRQQPESQQTPLSNQKSKGTDFTKQLLENWPLVALFSILVVLIAYIALNSLTPTEEPTPTVQTIVESVVPIKATEPLLVATSISVVSTATMPPTAVTSGIQPNDAQLSPLEMFRQEEDSFTTPLDERSGGTTVALLLDTSASMQNDDKLIFSRAGAIGFLNRLDDNDQILVFTYGDEARLLEPWGQVGDIRDELMQKLDLLIPDGEPMLYEALCQASDELTSISKSNPDTLPVIVLVTDGKDSGRGDILNASGVFDCLPESVQIHAIGLGTAFDEEFLTELINQKEGQFYETMPEEIMELFSVITFE